MESKEIAKLFRHLPSLLKGTGYRYDSVLKYFNNCVVFKDVR